jgi:hypothetical protein
MVVLPTAYRIVGLSISAGCAGGFEPAVVETLTGYKILH